MTTLVYRDGVIAADHQITEDYTKTHEQKIFFSGDAVIGITGDLYVSREFVNWYKKYATSTSKRINKPEYFNDEFFECLVCTKNKIATWSNYLLSVDMTYSDYIALGSGKDVANGALFVGASATDAVRAAAHHDLDTGGEVLSIDIQSSIKNKKLVRISA